MFITVHTIETTISDFKVNNMRIKKSDNIFTLKNSMLPDINGLN